MNVYSQLVQFFDQMEQQRRASLSRLPVKGYITTQELYQACSQWINLERGPFYKNGYKEHFENICANLRHPGSQHLALGLFTKLNNLNNMQLFLLIRLLTVTVQGSCLWDNLLETYTDRAQALFSEKDWQSIFHPVQDTYTLGDVLQYTQRTVCLMRPNLHIKQFLGKCPEK